MDDDERSIELEIEVVGTPEEVWQAIATGPGISSWYVPHTVEEREGGTAVAAFGPSPITTPPPRFRCASSRASCAGLSTGTSHRKMQSTPVRSPSVGSANSVSVMTTTSGAQSVVADETDEYEPDPDPRPLPPLGMRMVEHPHAHGESA